MKTFALLVGIGLFCLLVLFGGSVIKNAQSAPAVSVIATGNHASDLLAVQDADRQAAILAAAVGPACLGTGAFYQGIDYASREAFWDVSCANGTSYVVGIRNDSGGTASVLSCSDYEAATGLRCFRRLSDQPAIR